ncbi:putative WD repeat-containing protein all2124 [Nostoc sp, PCC 7120] [Rhizoctonia solani]|uniref:Putative WD repeat-containing protein all2124 [Nostoc sp, PCC 7120] n=1 Tax=Rhizoctonia solani TaxID=456999 RepID=A0A0K6G3G4_9AGAM|nr:putative WD repeat-containing protein all2124 [Nostoc sp, PCC 7120] [Rhizoctonia solani]
MENGTTQLQATIQYVDFLLSEHQIEFDAPNYFTDFYFGNWTDSPPEERHLQLYWRDPKLFSIIMTYLNGYSVFPLDKCVIPERLSVRQTLLNLRVDARFYRLGGLVHACDEQLERMGIEEVLKKREHENVVTRQEEYKKLHTELEVLFKDLRSHFSTGTPPAMTTSMLNLCGAIGTELRELYGTQDKSVISRLRQTEYDLDKIARCYRRIQSHLERIMLNATLNILRIVDKQATEAQLRQLNPSMPARYNSAEAHVVQRRECTPNTRQQVVSDLTAWKNKPDGQKLCWMSGMAGTGKTTIANTLCSTLDRDYELGASFFCTRSLPACRDVKLILPTIAYQLARFSDPFRGALLQVLDRDPDVHTKVLRVQFQRMILEPLQDVRGSLSTNLVIVIDALDECDDGNGVEQILEVLLDNVSQLPVKFLVSSRPEYHIRDRIGKSARKTQVTLHELDENVVKADIETYLRAELGSVPISLTERQLEELLERAGVLFIYAATAVRYIMDPKGDPLERLDALLQAPNPGQETTNKTKLIDALYETVLHSALTNPDLERFERQRMELVLHTVVCAQEPLTVDALAGLLCLDSTKVATALRPLWSVLHVSGPDSSDRVNMLHASFPDYMLDPRRSKQFTCTAEIHHGKMAELCLQRISQNVPQFNICSLASSYMFDEDVPGIDEKVKQAIPLDLLYACQYWAAHLNLGGSSDERATAVHDFLSKRLLLWMEVLSLTKRVERSIGLMEQAMSWLRGMGCSEGTMLLVQDARRFTTMFATSAVSRSTPHLYVSMLASWPEHKPIAHYFTRKSTELVQFKGIETTERQFGLLSSIPAGSDVGRVAYSSNGRFFAAGTGDGQIIIWDAASCRVTIDPIAAHDGMIRAIAFSPNETRICSGSFDKTLCIWDVENGQLVAGPLQGYIGHIYTVDYSPDGLWLVSGSMDGAVSIWSTDTWKQQGNTLSEPGQKVYSVAFSPDSTTFAVAHLKVIYIRDLLSGQRIGNPLEGHTESITSLAFLPDGKRLVSGSYDCTICVWDVSRGQVVFGPFHEHTNIVFDLKISPDGHSMVSAALGETIRIWNTQTWQSRTLFRTSGLVRSTALSPDGSRLVSGSSDGIVRIWEVGSVPEEQLMANQPDGHNSWIRSISFSPCGAYLVSGSFDRTVCIWDSQSKQLIHRPQKHRHYVLSVGVSTDSKYFYSVSEDRLIHVWSKQTGELEYTIGPIEADGQRDDDYDEFWPAILLFDNKRVVCGSMSGWIYIQDDGKPTFKLNGHGDSIYSIAFSPSRQLIASGSDNGVVMIWDATTRERPFGPLTGHPNCVLSIAFSPDGTQLASGCFDGIIRIWSSLTGTPVGNQFEGHAATVYSVAFSPSGCQLVSGSRDKSLRVWDVASGQSIAVFEGHTDIVYSVGFSPDGAQIASGSADNTIRLWKSPAQR